MAERGTYTYEYPRPMVTVDAIVFVFGMGRPAVLLVERKQDPYAGMWALPGGFVELDEELKDAAARELEEETGIRGVALRQLGAYGAIGRDPRGRSIGVAFVGTIAGAAPVVEGADDALDARWWPFDELPPLAFDHGEMLADARRDPGIAQFLEGARP